MAKQKLTPKARAAKEARDLRYANTPDREKKRAENQKIRRAAKKAGDSLAGKDVHHSGNGTSIISTHSNRGNFGKGTKREHPSAPRRHNID